MQEHHAVVTGAVLGLTRALALELARTGITVNAVCPGYTDTELSRAADRIAGKTGRSAETARRELAAANPQGRLIRPDEVAATVLWLVSDGTPRRNGAAIPISGGEA
jgi:NAD(P)-dependent dehydrogenase (short-subunit alcohol dehydrogenase family)